MRIGINAFFQEQPSTGSGQYLRHLCRALEEIDQENEYLLLGPAGPPVVMGLGTGEIGLRVSNRSSNLTKVWFEQFTFPLRCRQAGVDVAHVPYFAPPLLPMTRTVVTIHDLVPSVLPAYRGSVLVRLYTKLVTLAARSADAVITDSQFSKDDIMRHLGLSESAVHIIPLAVDESYRSVEANWVNGARRHYELPPRYIVYLGGFDQRKNVPALIRAYARARVSLDQAFGLVIAGHLPQRRSRLFPDPRQEVEALGLQDAVTFIGWVAEADKPLLYAGASLFVYPSLYEGFGLPPLEAMASGTPVVTSDVASLPEVVGDAAVLVDPQDEQALAEAMVRVLSDAALQAELRQKGQARAREFTWERVAREVLRVYQEVAARIV